MTTTAKPAEAKNTRGNEDKGSSRINDESAITTEKGKLQYGGSSRSASHGAPSNDAAGRRQTDLRRSTTATFEDIVTVPGGQQAHTLLLQNETDKMTKKAEQDFVVKALAEWNPDTMEYARSVKADTFESRTIR